MGEVGGTWACNPVSSCDLQVSLVTPTCYLAFNLWTCNIP